MCNSSKKILEMIEKVSPDDTNTFDEIDCRFYAWYMFEEYHSHLPSDLDWECKHTKRPIYSVLYTRDPSDERVMFDTVKPFTRSRDALKAIRPEGWTWVASTNDNGCHFNFYSPNPDYMRNLSRVIPSDFLPTEELAELHAIVQAIEWERENK